MIEWLGMTYYFWQKKLHYQLLVVLPETPWPIVDTPLVFKFAVKLLFIRCPLPSLGLGVAAPGITAGVPLCNWLYLCLLPTLSSQRPRCSFKSSKISKAFARSYFQSQLFGSTRADLPNSAAAPQRPAQEAHFWFYRGRLPRLKLLTQGLK